MWGISLTALMRSWIAHAVVMGSLGCEQMLIAVVVQNEIMDRPRQWRSPIAHPLRKCDHRSLHRWRSPIAPSLIHRCCCDQGSLSHVPLPLAISHRPHHSGFIIYRSTLHHHLRIPDPPPNSALGGPNTINNKKMKNISNGIVILRGVGGCRRCRRARMSGSRGDPQS